MRRMFIFLVILTLLPLAALCETGAQRLQALDILSQRDERLTKDEYFYRGMTFSIAGCLPACIANALLGLLGTPETDAPALLQEVMQNCSTKPNSASRVVSPNLLPGSLSVPREDSVQLHTLLASTTGVIDLSGSKLTPAELLARCFPTSEDHPLVIREMPISDNWSWLLELTGELCRQGHADARFALCAAGAGTDNTDAPFASGASGHYITLYFTAGEFYEEGTFYLLDSLPRALPGDIYGLEGHYPARYPFTLGRHPFSTVYDATRLTDPVMMFTLTEDARALRAAENSTTLRRKQAEAIELYGYPYFMLYIP